MESVIDIVLPACNPLINIKVGSLHLYEQILKFGNVEKAILAYNMGETRLRSLLRKKQPLPGDYLNKVVEYYSMLKENYPV